MGNSVDVAKAYAAIAGALVDYGDEIKQGLAQDVESTGKECLKLVKEYSPRRKGKRGGGYRKGWRVKKFVDSRNRVSMTIYNKPHYRLTHLLEDGHLNRDGSRTEGKPHIEPAARAAEAILMKKVELTIGSAGRDD